MIEVRKARQVTSDPRLTLPGLINGFQITQAIHVAATLRVADHLNDGARSAGELAALTKSHPDSLYRLLRDAPWRPTIVSVGHHGTLHRFHDAIIDLAPRPVSQAAAG